MKSNWYEWGNEKHSYKLYDFLREYNFNKPEKFNIVVNTQEYICELVLSDKFKGLTYMKCNNVETGEAKNFAVGDDNIAYWKPEFEAPDLMVG